MWCWCLCVYVFMCCQWNYYGGSHSSFVYQRVLGIAQPSSCRVVVTFHVDKEYRQDRPVDHANQCVAEVSLQPSDWSSIGANRAGWDVSSGLLLFHVHETRWKGGRRRGGRRRKNTYPVRAIPPNFFAPEFQNSKVLL